MIRLESMAWAHAFSYGPDNFINFDKVSLTQLVGKNGHGKSSIALILEEVLFNKNSKGVKKANILNRYTNAKKYTITLNFSVNANQYIVTTARGATQTVKLLENGLDISAHTSTATYKLIEEILGMDHKTFTQIVYQSSAFNLEFLTATDSNRKKFLIELLSLVKYTEKCDEFKAAVKEVGNIAEVATMKLTTVNTWLTKFSKESIDELPLREEPDHEFAQSCETQLPNLQKQIATVDATNKSIVQNNKYKEILAGINITPIAQPQVDIVSLRVALKEAEGRVTKLDNAIRGIGPIITKCSSCGQAVDSSHKQTMLTEARLELPAAKQVVTTAQAEVAAATKLLAEYTTYVTAQQEWERYYGFIDKTMATEVADVRELSTKKQTLENTIAKYHRDLKEVREYNAKVAAHNAKVKVLVAQLDTMRSEKAVYAQEVAELTARLTNLGILVKAFGTSGLVAYKIECLVKDLEELVNEYLQDMSDGRFQLTFTISPSDKLDVVITDNGHDIDIFALSNGELARVNISTLLAIRKLMQSLSDTRINLLILDETIEALDVEGKDRLIEVLLNEEHLNTILVSHGFSHPLLEKISIVKDSNVSRIE